MTSPLVPCPKLAPLCCVHPISPPWATARTHSRLACLLTAPAPQHSVRSRIYTASPHECLHSTRPGYLHGDPYYREELCLFVITSIRSGAFPKPGSATPLFLISPLPGAIASEDCSPPPRLIFVGKINAFILLLSPVFN